VLVGITNGAGIVPNPEPMMVTLAFGKLPFKLTPVTIGLVRSPNPVTQVPIAFDWYCGI
jgi:hypothetical protein